jgi:hypothetical protein
MKLAALVFLILTCGMGFAAEKQKKAKAESRELVLPDLSQAQKQLDQRKKITVTTSDGCEVNTANKPWKKDMTCPATQTPKKVQVEDPSAFKQPRTYNPDQESMTGTATFETTPGN